MTDRLVVQRYDGKAGTAVSKEEASQGLLVAPTTVGESAKCDRERVVDKTKMFECL